jgi:hypothetical protein
MAMLLLDFRMVIGSKGLHGECSRVRSAIWR